MDSTKICPRCKVEKPLDEFRLIRKGTLRDCYCKACRTVLVREWRSTPTGTAKMRASRTRYYERHKNDLNLIASRQRRREKVRTDPEAKAKAYISARRWHLSKLAESPPLRRGGRWVGKDDSPPKNYREKAAASARQYRRRLRLAALARYGMRCVCCGETEPCFLTFDHINGDGAKEYDKYGANRGSLPLYRSLLKTWREDIRILCCNCNFGRERNNGICPHQQK